MADDGLKELLVKGIALLGPIIDDAEIHAELAVEGQEGHPCGILSVSVALNEEVDVAVFRSGTPSCRTEQHRGSYARNRSELPRRRPNCILEPRGIHPSTFRQMDSMVSKLFRAFARSAFVPEFP